MDSTPFTELRGALGELAVVVIAAVAAWVARELNKRIGAGAEKLELDNIQVAATMAVRSVEEWSRGLQGQGKPVPTAGAKLARAKTLLQQATGIRSDWTLEVAILSALSKMRDDHAANK